MLSNHIRPGLDKVSWKSANLEAYISTVMAHVDGFRHHLKEILDILNVRILAKIDDIEHTLLHIVPTSNETDDGEIDGGGGGDGETNDISTWEISEFEHRHAIHLANLSVKMGDIGAAVEEALIDLVAAIMRDLP